MVHYVRTLLAAKAGAPAIESSSGPLVLVNADDFGISPAVNCAIVNAFRERLIDTCTIMANFPAFEEACDAAHAGGFSGRVGLHFVLDEGIPLTEELRREPRFCAPDGRMFPRRRNKFIRLSSSEKRAVAAELRAQIARCRAFGLPLTHLDSHHHIHEELGIIGVVLPTLKEQGVPFVRPMQNLSISRTLVRRIYTHIFNTELRRRGVSWTRYFGAVSDYERCCASQGAPPPGETVELMVHPTMDPAGTIVDAVDHAPLSERLCAVRKCRRPASPAVLPALQFANRP